MSNFVNEKLNDFGQLYGGYTNQEPISHQLLQGQHLYLANLSFDRKRPLNTPYEFVL